MSDDSATAIKCPLCAVTVPADKVDLPESVLAPPLSFAPGSKQMGTAQRQDARRRRPRFDNHAIE
jgi:hypothetical protein